MMKMKKIDVAAIDNEMFSDGLISLYEKGGKPIIAMSAVTSRGESKIVPFLKPGAGVVTTRAHVHFVVTEFGIAYLHGLTIEERANALIKIAAPEHREQLEKKFYEAWS